MPSSFVFVPEVLKSETALPNGIAGSVALSGTSPIRHDKRCTWESLVSDWLKTRHARMLQLSFHLPYPTETCTPRPTPGSPMMLLPKTWGSTSVQLAVKALPPGGEPRLDAALLVWDGGGLEAAASFLQL